ncbi:glycosyltransferase family 2 protein [Geodermatophilus normandii]|uniref:Glycosyltransferase n=1 Tax=Geodermatophilus normandii TaxID=1137989 RepID=A0A6P0GFC5_9ACTN|nr:glycosyltransferase [Geodermatophilus normandii]NEM05967.1 glycosyltransferase [Geodermatophilus normandii]
MESQQAAPTGAPASTWCGELELTGAPAVTGVRPYGGQPRARVLVRLHGDPVGYVDVPAAGAGPDAAEVARAGRERHAPPIAAHLEAEGVRWAPGDEVPAPAAGCPGLVASDTEVTVVVCTRDRGQALAGCLERLAALTHPHLELLVVDNAPSDDGTRRVVEAFAARDPRFRHVVEPRPGLSRARNRGLTEARGAVIAYTDDDVAVDPGWVQGLLRGFARRPDVGCVTGLVATAGVDSTEEAYFDARAASWSTRCEPELYDLAGSARDDVLYPYSAGVFGTGANFAFDTAVLRDLGGFDEALGAGAPTRGGEDLDVFVRVLRAGHALAYEPAALVWHHHRADHAALLRQLYGYGTGLTAYLTKCLLQPDVRRDLVRRIPGGVRHAVEIRRRTGERLGEDVPPPRGALASEVRGYLTGPALYLRARRASARSRASA